MSNKALASVTVGIPIYNEEKNIKRLLYSLAFQDIRIKSTVLINDGSTDKTLEILKKIKNNNNIKKRLKIYIIDLKENKGKNNALNLIFTHAQSDCLILLDSDVYFSKNDTLKRLLKCFNGNDVGLVCGWYNIEVLRPFYIIGRAYRFSGNFLEKMDPTLNNIYGATGAIMVLPKDVYKNLILPENITRDDAYIYLHVLSLGKKFVFCPDAKVTIPLLNKETLRMFLHKQIRARSIPEQHLETFRSLAKREFNRPDLKIFLKAFLYCFARYPVDGTIWVALKIISYFYRKLNTHTDILCTWRKVGF